jgi:hypothetical protein
MPLEILLVLVVGGIAAIAVLTHLFGLSRRAGFADEDAARAGWLREFPDEPVTGVTLLSDGHAALITTGHGAGIVWTMGADTVARHLAGARAQRRGDRLILRFPDWGAPRLALRVTGDEARAILAHLEEDAWVRT